MSAQKVIYKSKTLWVNLLMALPAVIDMVSVDDPFGIPQSYYAVAVLIVNVVLRSYTKEPVVLRNKKPK